MDDVTLTSIRVHHSNRADEGLERLAVGSTPPGVLAAYDSVTGELTIVGLAPIAAYEQVLRSITYENDSDTPNTSERVLDVIASDGVSQSPVASSIVLVVAANDAPVADPQETSTPEDEALTIVVTGSDPENDPITFSVATAPAHGTLSALNAEAARRRTPRAPTTSVPTASPSPSTTAR